MLLALVALGALVVYADPVGHHERDRRPAGPSRRRRRTRSRAGSTTSAWTRARASNAEQRGELVRDRQRQQAAARRRGRHRRALVAPLLPRHDGAEPDLPARGRPQDPGVGRAAHGRPAGRGAHGHGPDPPVAPRLLPRRDDRGRVQRRSSSASGALILGVPLAGTIALVTLLGAYVPYLGAWTAGAFSVLLALGGAGTDAAVGMIVVQILANGVLQQTRPAARDGRGARHPPARGPDRDDRRRRPVRRDRADPGGAD